MTTPTVSLIGLLYVLYSIIILVFSIFFIYYFIPLTIIPAMKCSEGFSIFYLSFTSTVKDIFKLNTDEITVIKDEINQLKDIAEILGLVVSL